MASHEYYQPHCGGVRFFLAKESLFEPVAVRLTLSDFFLRNISLNDPAVVDIRWPANNHQTRSTVTIAYSSNCYYDDSYFLFRDNLIDECYRKIFHQQSVRVPCSGEQFVFTDFYTRGPENLTMDCLTPVGNGWSLTLYWQHPLLSPPAGDRHYQDMKYRIQVNSSLERYDYQTAIQREAPGAPEPGSEELFPRPQQFELPIEPGNSYQVLITPEYPGLIEVDQDAVSHNLHTYETRCDQQRLYHEIVIPPETEVQQELETVILHTAGQGGYEVRILGPEGQQLGETYQDSNGTTDVYMNTSTLAEGPYQAQVTYPGSSAIPCRTETLTFTLTTPPVTTGKPTDSLTRRTTVQAETTTMLASSQYRDNVNTPYSEQGNKQPGTDNPVSYVGYAVFGVELLAIVTFSAMGVIICMHSYQRNHAEL